jgi:hypothetical protein
MTDVVQQFRLNNTEQRAGFFLRSAPSQVNGNLVDQLQFGRVDI